jgi:hypothetical protein
VPLLTDTLLAEVAHAAQRHAGDRQRVRFSMNSGDSPPARAARSSPSRSRRAPPGRSTWPPVSAAKDRSSWIPAAPQANSNVYYWFSAGSGNAVGRIADFTIDQVSHQGEWVSHGPLTFPGDTVLVKVTDQGEGPPTADAEADPLRVTC